MKENKKTESTKLSILKDAVNSGILDIDSVLDTLMSTKREKILKIHSYAITPPASENGRWQTYYKDEKESEKTSKHNQKRNYWIN